MRIVALMTAKGNNTLSRKNLLPVSGHPLMWYPATVAKHCPQIDDFFVSSDSDEILELCKSIGYKAIKRPDYLALPASQHIDAINHALEYIKINDKIIPDILIVLLGNTVFLKCSWVNEAIRRLTNDQTLTSVTPVYQEQDSHPYRARKLDESGCVIPWFDFKNEKISTNRQELSNNFFFSHNFWAIRLVDGKLPEEGYQPWTFMGRRVSPLIIEEGFDVHTMEDISKCEKWLSENKIFD